MALIMTLLLPAAAIAEKPAMQKGFPVETPTAPEEIVPTLLPIDFTGGMPVNSKFYADDRLSYSDPTITVSIESGRYENCDWWAARIKISDASQLRTGSAGGFDSNMTMNGPALARRLNAILAVDGDYYCFSNRGYIKRQGTVFWSNISGYEDMLFIDDKGDFHIARNAKQEDVDRMESEYRIINCLTFGPALVLDGKLITDYTMVTNRKASEPRQRMCIAQVGELEYLCVCSASAARGSYGLDLYQFSSLVASFGVQNAYNLDGGDSTIMVFGGEKINDIRNPDTRQISDIVYFASGYKPE
ncbi:MAG: phosphodiester glycosidase family protein [Eubacteriales bacterium]|nr:phosphodiester glycosidase family protein [Eubacteriales bacterium]MDD3881383.1 phosphodiester glycosidase family protein [Eubacteriales bacterium]MDD4513070.1 phosphodiester glycosidase family protein [Eubacteriales bacterium]